MMVRSRKYVVDAIDEVLTPEGAFARDLVVPVSEIIRRYISVSSLSYHLSVMYIDGKVGRIPRGEKNTYFWYKVGASE